MCCSIYTIKPFFADANASYEDARYVILGVPFDRTCSFRSGAKEGPQAIRSSAENFETYLHEHDIDLLDIPICDIGDIEEFIRSEDMIEAVEETVSEMISSDRIPIILGGEHSVSPPVVKALASKYKDLAVVVIDAHLDFRDEYLNDPNSHACATRRISEHVGVDSVIPVGVRSMSKDESKDAQETGLFFCTAQDVRERGMAKVTAEILVRFKDRPLYLSIDVDGMDPSFMPATGTPEPFGLSDLDVKQMIDDLAHTLVGMDIVEVAPPLDSGNSAALAARLVREFIAVHHKSHL